MRFQDTHKVIPTLALAFFAVPLSVFAAVGFDNYQFSVPSGGSGVYTVNYAMGSVSDGVLVVHTETIAPDSITFNGVALTYAGTYTESGDGAVGTSWYLLNPASGTHALVTNLTGEGEAPREWIESFSGAGTPHDFQGGGQSCGFSSCADAAITFSNSGGTDWASVAQFTGNVGSYTTAGTPWTERTNGAYYVLGDSNTTMSGVTTYTMSGAWRNMEWGLSIPPASGGGGGGGGGESTIGSCAGQLDNSASATYDTIAFGGGSSSYPAQQFPLTGCDVKAIFINVYTSVAPIFYDYSNAGISFGSYTASHPDASSTLFVYDATTTVPSGNYTLFLGSNNSSSYSSRFYGAGTDVFPSYNFGGGTVSFHTVSDLGRPRHVYALAFNVCDTDACSLATGSGSRTRIVTVSPANNSIVATGTISVAATGFVAPDDFVSGTVVVSNLRSRNIYGSACAGSLDGSGFGFPVCTDTTFATFRFPVTSAGVFSFSTTTATSTTLGGFYLDTTIERPHFSIFGFNFGSTALVSTTTVFTVSTSTAYDIEVKNFNKEIASTTSAFLSSACILNFSGSFNLRDCFLYLVIPSAGDMSYLWKKTYDGILTKWPIGYLTRFTTVMTTGVAIEPPPLTYKAGSSSPAILQSITASDPISFQLFDHFDVITMIHADDGTNKNIWQVIDPYVQMATAFALLFYILSRLFGTHLFPLSNGFDSHGAVADTSRKDDSYKLKEWLYSHKK